MTTAMAAAFEAAGAPAPVNGKKKSRRRWKTAHGVTETTINWVHDIGKLSLAVKGFPLGYAQVHNGYYFAPVRVGHRHSSKLDLEFTANLAEEIVALYSQDGNLVECGTKPIPRLSVPVHWLRKGQKFKDGEIIPAPKNVQDDGTARPHTRQRGKDNADVIFSLPDGSFIDLQASLVTYGGSFTVCMQEIFAGQVVKVPDITTYALHYKTTQVGDDHYIVKPIWAEFAYPGADFMLIMPQMGPKVVKMLVEAGRFAEMDELEIPEWDPPAAPDKPGWPASGVVLFYNPLVGARVLGTDGAEYFAPPSVIPTVHGELAVKEGGFPVLYPRQPIVFRWKEPAPGQKNRIITELEALPVKDTEDTQVDE